MHCAKFAQLAHRFAYTGDRNYLSSTMPSNKAFQPLSKSDVAEILGISIKCLDNWVNSGILLPPAKLGNKVYWHPDAFYEWLDAVFRQQHARKSQ